MAGLRIEGNTSGNVAEVTSSNEVKVALSKTPQTAGYIIPLCEVDSGSVTGAVTTRSTRVTRQNRAKVNTDTILLNESFNYAAQNSGTWQNVATTMTFTYNSAGALLLNGTNITTISTGAMLKSYRYFPLFSNSTTYFETSCLLTQTPQANNIVEIGCGLTTTAIAAVTDGVLFRYDASGVLKGVLNYNNSEIFTDPLPVPEANAFHKYNINVTDGYVDFWIDDILQGSLQVPTAVSSPVQSGSLPVYVRVYNPGTPTISQQVKVSGFSVSVGGFETSKPWAHQISGSGANAIQGVGGYTQGQTANYANSAAPASAALSNTTAGYTTLGGQFQFAAVAGAETDYALFAFQVPAATALITGKSLYITDVAIDIYNTVVPVATTATVFQWGLAVGSTAVSLATAEAATAKAPRRIPLGVQCFQVGAAVGQCATQIVRAFTTPPVVNPGEFLHVILKMPIGTATATEIFRGTVSIVGYLE